MNECNEFVGLDDEKTVRVETCGVKVSLDSWSTHNVPPYIQNKTER